MSTSTNKSEKIHDPGLKYTFVPLPSTTRGSASIIGVHPKESKIIYCSGKLIIIKDLDNPLDVLVYKGHNDTTCVAKFSPNGYWVASGDITGKIRIWSYDHPEHLLKLETIVFSGDIKDICWDSESKKVLAVGDGRGQFAKIFIWDTGNSVGELVGHQKRVLTGDIKYTRPFRLMTGGEDCNICYYEGPPFKFQKKISDAHSNFVNCLRYSPNGEYIVSVGSDKNIVLYNGKNGDLIDKFPIEHSGSIYSVSWNKDNTNILTSSADKTVKLWDVSRKKVIKDFTFPTENIKNMQVATTFVGEKYKISVSLSGNINYLDESNPNKPSQIIQGHQVNILAIASKKDCFFTGSYDGVVCVWDKLTSFAYEINGKSHIGKIVGIVCNDDMLASVGWDDTIRFAKINDNISLKSMEYHSVMNLNGQPTSVCISSNSMVIVTTTKSIVLIVNEKIVNEIKIETSNWTPTCCSITRDGSTCAVGSEQDKKIRLYNIVNNKLVESCEFTGHLGSLTCLSFSPDGLYLAAGDSYREIRVWDVQTKTPKIQGLWVFHSTRITCIEWSHDSERIVSGSLDEHIYIWNINKTMYEKKYEFAHKDGVTGITFYNKNHIISTGNDSCVHVWES